MLENGVEFEVFPLIFNKNKFKYSKFYLSLLQAERDEIDAELLEPAEKLEELNIRLKRKEFKKRILARIDFQLTGQNLLGVKLFSLFRKFKKPSAKVLHSDHGVQLTRLTKHRCKETGALLTSDQVGRFYPLGDEKIVFSTDEMEALRSITPQQFVLVGFKPKSSLKIYHNTGPSIFIIADDERVSNSSKVFDALIKEMTRRNRIAIVKAKLKENSTMRFCALVPQEEKRDKDAALVPNGFHMIVLPYSDEIRRLNAFYPTTDAEPTEEELFYATNLISSLTVDDFDPKTFENPEIQNFYAVLQALALKEEMPDQVTDYLQPDLEGLESRIEVFQAFNQCFFPQIYGYNEHADGFDKHEEQKDKCKKDLHVGEIRQKDAESDGLKLIEIKKKIIQRDVKNLKLADLEYVMTKENIRVDKKLPKKELIEHLAQLI